MLEDMLLCVLRNQSCIYYSYFAGSLTLEEILAVYAFS